MSHAYEAEQILLQNHNQGNDETNDATFLETNETNEDINQMNIYTGRKHKPTIAICHSSNIHGRLIVNAVTGCPFSDLNICVGDREEDIFFRVMDATGYRGEPSKYYYTNPEEYMAHTGNIIPSQEQGAWHNKQINR